MYHLRVYGFVYRMTFDQRVAEDITHEVFVFLIEGPERFCSERGSLLTYLCAVARNHVMNYLRLKHHSDVSYDETGNDVAEFQARNNPLADLLNKELANQIENCIAALPPLQREVIILREFEDLSYEEISRVTEAELNAVKGRLHRARQTLANRLAAYIKQPKKKHHELC
jgi:RNA polymerase sigma-70 factor (ECF subfamily)